MVRVVRIRLLLSNAFLLLGRRPVLVDTGVRREEARIVRALERVGVRPRDIALIVLTHGHADHAGSAAALRELCQAPIAMHYGDVDMVRQGRNRPLAPLCLTGRLARRWLDLSIPPFEPDIELEESRHIDELGVPCRVLHTPGHTRGSTTLLVGDKIALAGDLVVGGFLGGLLLPRLPGWPYFAENPELLRPSLAKLLRHGPSTVYVGHGGPLELPALARWHELLEEPSEAPNEAPLLDGAGA